MSAQSNTEKVLRSLHVLLSKSEPYPKEPTKVIVDKQQMLDLLSELNTCIYQIMEEHEMTTRSRDKAEREFRKKSDQIIWDASRKAEDIYAASVMYMDEALNGIQDIMRQANEAVDKIYMDIPVTETYGYITKYYRELYHVEKSHINDAVMISKNFKAVADDTYYVSEAVRHHNRQLHKNTILKGGVRKRNQAPHVVKNFRLFDLVKYEGDYYYVFGRRSNGFMDTRTLDGKKINKGSISNKRLNFVSTSKGLLVERKKAIPLADKPASFLA